MARLEGQVVRYKTAAETSEKVEDELKVERRKLQREVMFGLNKILYKYIEIKYSVTLLWKIHSYCLYFYSYNFFFSNNYFSCEKVCLG